MIADLSISAFFPALYLEGSRSFKASWFSSTMSCIPGLGCGAGLELVCVTSSMKKRAGGANNASCKTTTQYIRHFTLFYLTKEGRSHAFGDLN